MLRMVAEAFIHCRVPAATKAALGVVARYQGLTDSALLKRMIDLTLQSASAVPMVSAAGSGDPGRRPSRLMVRLHADDQMLLRERASARGMAPATFLVSYARRSPGRRDHLTPAQVQQIARTAGCTPEVMVKVLPRGANDLGAVQRHLDYIGRDGEFELETDDGRTLAGDRVGKDLLEDWDLELDAQRGRVDLAPRPGRQPPRLVHKLIFSMPAGTPPDKVFKAARNFCREEFALQHRYAMALHTDEPHPHVHVVMKAVNEQGVRLHIRKATLRQWREGFARHLRVLGVPANATQRYVRGETSPRKSDGIYRASLRGDSTHMRERAEAVARDLARGGVRAEPGKAKLMQTRESVRRAWWAVSEILIRDKQPELAAQVRRFAERMPPPMTDREWFQSRLVERIRPTRAREGPTQ